MYGIRALVGEPFQDISRNQMFKLRSAVCQLGLALVSCSQAADLGAGARPKAQGGSSGDAAGGTSSSAGTPFNLGGSLLSPGEPAQGRPLPTCTDCGYPQCEVGKATSISGTVRTPARVSPDPLYNAVVYLPGAAVEPFSAGVSCDRCGNVSGKPVAAALSDTSGHFKLDGVPSGHDISLVVQMGRWRRQVKLPEVVACQDNVLPEELTRLPRNRNEGDIPHVALVTSEYDFEECILRKIGIDDAEFTKPTEAGRVHLFWGTGTGGGNALPSGKELWDDPSALARYDMVLLPCASAPRFLYGDPSPGSYSASYQAVADYANAGGRVFATDLSYPWIWDQGSPFATAANWVDDPGPASVLVELDALDSRIDTSFPKGQALADWLQGIGATTTRGEIMLHETFRRSLSVNPPTQRWLYSTTPDSLQSFTFNTPLGATEAQQCGRFAYSSFHIATGQTNDPFDPVPKAVGTFPMECDSAPLTPQERVLEFMLFDLASCVQIDMGDPKPPEVVK